MVVFEKLEKDLQRNLKKLRVELQKHDMKINKEKQRQC